MYRKQIDTNKILNVQMNIAQRGRSEPGCDEKDGQHGAQGDGLDAAVQKLFNLFRIRHRIPERRQSRLVRYPLPLMIVISGFRLLWFLVSDIYRNRNRNKDSDHAALILHEGGSSCDPCGSEGLEKKIVANFCF